MTLLILQVRARGIPDITIHPLYDLHLSLANLLGIISSQTIAVPEKVQNTDPQEVRTPVQIMLKIQLFTNSTIKVE